MSEAKPTRKVRWSSRLGAAFIQAIARTWRFRSVNEEAFRAERAEGTDGSESRVGGAAHRATSGGHGGLLATTGSTRALGAYRNTVAPDPAGARGIMRA